MADMQAISKKVSSIFSSKRFNLIAFALIAGMILIAYSNTFTASFHFDDNPSIVENPHMKRVTMDNIMYLLSSNRPVVDLTLMLNYQLERPECRGWHIFNIGVSYREQLFWFILLILLDAHACRRCFRYADKAKRMALFGALLFAVHPIQTESVTYIITRSELVTSFFYLTTILLFIKGRDTE